MDDRSVMRVASNQIVRARHDEPVAHRNAGERTRAVTFDDDAAQHRLIPRAVFSEVSCLTCS
jgi:UDP-N-acetylglucosamine 2-epimerase